MKKNVYGIVCLICGIIGLLLSCIFIGVFPALVGLAFSLLGLSQKNTKHGTSIAGLICSIVAICIGVFMALIFAESMEKKAEKITQSSIDNSYVYETEESTEKDPQLCLINAFCSCSVAKSCPTLCDPMNCSKLGSSIFHYLLGFAQIHVH